MRLTIALSLAALPAAAQQPAFELTIPSIMRGPEIVGREPGQVRWSADGRYIYFSWLPAGTDWREALRPFRVRATPGVGPEEVSRAHMDTMAPLLAEGLWNQARTSRVVEADGDLFLVSRAATVRRLTGTVEAETSPRFSSDDRRVYFRRGDNGYAFDLATGGIQQLTDFRPGPAPKDDSTASGQRGFLDAQQRELFEAVRERRQRDSVEKVERKERESWRVRTLYLDKDERILSLSISPNGRAGFFRTETSAAKDRDTKVPEWVTRSGYTEEITSRNKVGDEQDGGRTGIVALPSGAVRWLSLGPGDSTHSPRSVTLAGWSPDGAAALVFAASSDFKRRYLYRIPADTTPPDSLDVLTDSAWVGGPCFACGGWYDRGRRVWFVSEADGYAHLYSMAANGTDRRQLTRGRWEVFSVSLSQDERYFYLHTSEASPYQRQFYRMPVYGGPREQLTSEVGAHAVTLSRSEEWLADLHSTANRPAELFLRRNRAGAETAQLTTSPTAAWLGFQWIIPPIVAVPASDSVPVPARIYRPQDLGAAANGAGVIFVHGAGYLHNVHHYWSSYYREYMFHHLLAKAGYVVLDIDYRGSAGYGRAWRTAVYRHMGGRDLQDQVDGARYLQKEFGIDPERIGIYGGSYGGFITLMALFTEPKWFGAGAALRSVTDWAHYSHGYTGAILNLPQDDSLAYRQSSPIYFAEGLEDPLLIAHGMVDDNVHFQDVVRLAERLIELGKTEWEMAVYPVESHGFVRPDSWIDEYRRIFELFEDNLRD